MTEHKENDSTPKKDVLIIRSYRFPCVLLSLFFLLTFNLSLYEMIKYKYYPEIFLLGIAILIGYIVFGARLVLLLAKGYEIDVNGVTVIWFQKWKRFYRWEEFLTARKYMLSADQITRESVKEMEDELSAYVCSLLPVRTNRRGEISVTWAMRHPFRVYLLGFRSWKKEAKFESLRRGEISPDLEDQEPDEEE